MSDKRSGKRKQSLSSRRAFIIVLLAVTLVCVALATIVVTSRNTSQPEWSKEFIDPQGYKRQLCGNLKDNDNPAVQRTYKEECIPQKH